MDISETEAEFCMRRAREEARLALTADRPEVAAAHHGMSVRYSARAREARMSATVTRMAVPLRSV